VNGVSIVVLYISFPLSFLIIAGFKGWICGSDLCLTYPYRSHYITEHRAVLGKDLSHEPGDGEFDAEYSLVTFCGVFIDMSTGGSLFVFSVFLVGILSRVYAGTVSY
jgi:hypothetical protein